MKIQIQGMFAEVATSTAEELIILKEILTFKKSRNSDDEMVLFDESDEKFLSGLSKYVERNFKLRGREIEIVTNTSDSKQIEVKPIRNVVYREYQSEAIDAALKAKCGVIKIATAGGKTVVAAGIIKSVGMNSLFLITQIPLLHQVVKKFNDFGIPDVGMIGDGRIEITSNVVAYSPYLSQLLSGRSKHAKMVRDFLYGVKVVICDEVQHAAAKSWTIPIVNCSNSEFRIGLSGTPFEQRSGDMSYRDAQLTGLTGPLLYEIKAEKLIKDGHIAKPMIFMFPVSGTIKTGVLPKDSPSWMFQKNYNKIFDEGIANNFNRNKLAVELILTLAKVKKLQTLVLVSRIEHGKLLLNKLFGAVPAIFVAGQKRVFNQSPTGAIETRDEVTNFESKSVREFIDKKYDVMVASPVLGEGYDLPGSSVEAMIILTGGRGLVPVLQRLGRALRPKDNGGEVIIIDFQDDQHVYLKAHSNQRRREYESEGYNILTPEDFVDHVLLKGE